MQNLKNEHQPRAQWTPTADEAAALCTSVPGAFKKHDPDGVLSNAAWFDRLRLTAWCHADPVRLCHQIYGQIVSACTLRSSSIRLLAVLDRYAVWRACFRFGQ